MEELREIRAKEIGGPATDNPMEIRERNELVKDELINKSKKANDKTFVRIAMIEIRRLKISLTSLKQSSLELIKSSVKTAVEQRQHLISKKEKLSRKLKKKTRTEVFSRKRKQMITDRICDSDSISSPEGELKTEKLSRKEKKSRTEDLDKERDDERLSSFKKRARRDKGHYSKQAGSKTLPKEKFAIPIIKENDKFVCVVCNDKFENQVGLKLHFRHHSGSELWEGKEKQRLNTTEEGNEKMKKVADFVVSVFKCELCPEKCYTIANYRQHIIDNHQDSKEFLEKMVFTCTFCNFMFNIRHQLITHLRNFHDIFSQCPVCSKIIETEKLFSKHMNEIHSHSSNREATIFGYAEGYFCKLCGWAHESHSKVESHFEKTHSEKTYKCEHCEEECETKQLLNSHTRTSHPEKLISCEICNNWFIDITSMKSHKRMRHKGNVKKERFECKKCDKTFCKNSVYKAHYMAIHQHKEIRDKISSISEKKKAKERMCPDCGIVLNGQLLTFHRANFHQFGNTEENVCHLCNKTFKSSSTLYTHNQCYHKNRPKKSIEENKKAGELSCPDCGKGFRTESSVFNHWRLHMIERPFQCTMCEATFQHYAGFNVHKRLVHQNDEDTKMVTISNVMEKLKKDFSEANANKLTPSIVDFEDCI